MYRKPEELTGLDKKPDFDGQTYERELDQVRLAGQMLDVFRLMKSGAWWTLRELEDASYAPQASISARLRDLRKEKFGGHTVERQRIGGRSGTYQYRLIVNYRQAGTETVDMEGDTTNESK